MELQLKDLETIENRIAKYQKQTKNANDKDAKKALALSLKYKEILEQSKSGRVLELTNEEKL